MSAKKYFLKEPFIFDFDKFAKQTFSLVITVAFICALFLFSGIFLDATADESRAEVVPQAVSEVDAAAGGQDVPTSAAAQQREESPAAAQTADTDELAASEISDVVNAIAGSPLGDFIGITPFSIVFVDNPTDLANAINGFTGSRTVTLTNPVGSPIVLDPTTDITIASGANIVINSQGAVHGRTLLRGENDSRRHFLVDGNLSFYHGIILCGYTTGEFSMSVNEVNIGGGIHVRTGGTLYSEGTLTIQNSAADFGGGIRFEPGSSGLLLDGVIIRNNAATIHGGGIYASGPGTSLELNGTHILNNKVEGRVRFDAVPLSSEAIAALNNGTAVRNWYTANGIGGSDLTAPLPAHYEFPPNVSRGGGGIALRAGAWLSIHDGGTNSVISGNFAERGGGIYAVNSPVELGSVSAVRIVDNSAHHSYRRDSSISSPTAGVAPPTGGNPFNGNFNLPHYRASGSGGGIHMSGSGAILNILGPAQISRNISIAQVFGVTTGGGGGVALLNGAHMFMFSAGIIGGSTAADANMLTNWEPCEPAHNGVHITGGCTPNCHPNHPGIPAISVGPNPARNAGWSNLFPCVNGFNEGYNRVGANRVGWAVARGANGIPVSHDGAGVFIYNATATIEGGTIQHNRVCEAGNQTSSSNGGGMAVHGANSVVNSDANASFTYNSAGWRGGGIYIANGTINLNDDTLLAYNMVNIAGNGGGAALSGGVLNMNNNATIRDHRYSNTTGGFTSGGGIMMVGSNPRVYMNDNSLIANNRVNTQGGGVFMSGNAAAVANPAVPIPWSDPIPAIPTFTMSDNAQIRGNTANTNGGGVAITGHGNIFNMNNNATIGYRADASVPLPVLPISHGNTANNHGGGIFSTGNGVTINMSMGDGAGTTAIRGNLATNNGGGVLIGGTYQSMIPNPPAANPPHPTDEIRRTYPIFNIGATALIADNEARRAGTGAAGGGGGGIYVGNFNNDNSMAGVNLLGGTITRNSTGMTANTNGGGVKVRSQARGDNNTIAGLDNHYGFRATSGTISENVAAPTATAAANGNGGGIFTISYLHRSPLANNPLFEVPFVTQAQADDYIIRNYSNLNIAADTIFASNTAARRSFPPLGDQLPHVQWNPASGSSITYGQMPTASPAYINPPAAGTHLYIINNFDINYDRPNNDFWFVKEDLLGNPLPGALFRLNVGTQGGAAAPGSPAGTPAGTAAGERISLENGLVGFPLALSRYGPTQIYALTEVEVRNANGTINEAVVIPDGYWRVTLPTRLAELNFANSIVGEPEFDRNPGVDGHAHPTTLGRLMWRVHNLLIQPATFSFFKTDMSIYNTPPNQSPPRLTGANFSLYEWTPQAGSAQFANAVTPEGVNAGHWTLITSSIPHSAAANNAHIFNFVASGGADHDWVPDNGPAIFHLVETQAPSGFELPTGQWRFVLELDSTTGNAVTPNYDHIRPVLAPSSTAPAFVQPRIGQSPPDATWYVGNEQMIIPTGLTLESAVRTPLILSACAVALFFAARGAVNARKRIEELPSQII